MADSSYESWYNGLHHDKPAETMRELVEDIIWTALTIDLGPNGNTEPSTGTDEGDVYTDALIFHWVKEAWAIAERGQ